MTDDTPEQLRAADRYDAERVPTRRPMRIREAIGPLFDRATTEIKADVSREKED